MLPLQVIQTQAVNLVYSKPLPPVHASSYTTPFILEKGLYQTEILIHALFEYLVCSVGLAL